VAEFVIFDQGVGIAGFTFRTQAAFINCKQTGATEDTSFYNMNGTKRAAYAAALFFLES
jgi:hypothetical protein